MVWDNNKKQEKTNDVKPTIEFKSLSEVQEDRGLKILSYGDFSSGKTHFALTGKGPVYIIDTENGASPLAKKFPDAKVLNISSMNLDGVEEEQSEVENYIKLQQAVNYLVELPDNEIGTIVIDSLTDVWTWCQAYAKIKKFKLSLDDRLKQQFDWGIINAMYNRIIMKLINKKCNVVFTARQNEIYSGPGQPTGQYNPACQKKTPFFVDIVLYHTCRFVSGKFVFNAKISKMRQKGSMIGKTITEPSFEKLNKLIKEDEK